MVIGVTMKDTLSPDGFGRIGEFRIDAHCHPLLFLDDENYVNLFDSICQMMSSHLPSPHMRGAYRPLRQSWITPAIAGHSKYNGGNITPAKSKSIDPPHARQTQSSVTHRLLRSDYPRTYGANAVSMACFAHFDGLHTIFHWFSTMCFPNCECVQEILRLRAQRNHET